MWLLCIKMKSTSNYTAGYATLAKYLYVFLCFTVVINNTVFAQNPLFAKSKFIQNHSYSNYQIVRPYKLDLELDINMQDECIHGIAIYHLKWMNIGSKKVDLTKTNPSKFNGILSGMVSQSNDKVILDSKGLFIESVSGTAGLLTWHFGDSSDIFGKAIEIDAPQHDTIIQIHYRTLNKLETSRKKDFISAIQWLNPSQTHDKKHPFMFSQSQAILARTWLPCMDVPAVKFTYNAIVNYPSELNVVMSAQKFNDIGSFLKAYPKKTGEFRHLINPSNLNRRIYFHQSLPITSYLMAIAVGDFQSKKLGENCLVYAESGLLEKAAYEFADLPKMIDSASALYGKYAWKEYNVLVLPPSFPFGGMENPVVTFATPTIITGDRSLVSLLAHELAHSWSGNLVTNETWNDFWLNEGFTVYFESRIMEKIYGKDYADMLTVLGLGGGCIKLCWCEGASHGCLHRGRLL